MATSGYFWLLLAIFGYFGHFWLLLCTLCYFWHLLTIFGYFWLLSLDGSSEMKEGATWRGYVDSFRLTVHLAKTLPQVKDVQAWPGQD